MSGFTKYLSPANSTNNADFIDVIGNKQDKSFSNGATYPSIAGGLRALYYHIHSPAGVYPAGDNPVTLTDKNDAGVTPWGHGTIVEVIPASTIETYFDIHFIVISSISAVDDYEIRLYKGAPAAEVIIATIALSRSSNFSQEGNQPVQVVPIPSNTRISASLASNDSDGSTCAIKLYYHTYPDLV